MSDSTQPSSPNLKSIEWFPAPPAAKEEGATGALIKLGIGVAVGVVFFALGARTLAIVVWVLAILIGVISLASSRGRSGLARGFAALGRFVGHWVTMIVLVPTYVVGFTVARGFTWLSGRDPLHMRDSGRPTYWLECDRDDRKVRHIRSMFTTEAPVAGGRRLLPLAATLLALVVGAELLLRMFGFGDPVLYRSDAAVGYLPAPNQDVSRTGNAVHINEFGMRSPNVSADKPEGALRILMIGDSTLYGGSYIDQDELYATRLGATLAERTGGAAPEVLCAGVNGWGPFHKLGYIEKYGAFGADIAIICLPYGDIYRPWSGLEGKPYLPDTSPPSLALEEVAYHLLWRIQASAIGGQSDSDREYNAKRGIAAYVALGQELRRAGCEVFFEILPSRTAGTTDTIPEDERRRVAELTLALEGAGFPVAFRARAFRDVEADGPIYHDEVHLHSEGHRLYAELLGASLAERSKRLSEWAARVAKGGAPAAGGQS